jgi:hydrophobe/amphiphile efflux-1 (HAE1) family protein
LKFVDIWIKQPVLSIVLSLALVVLGIVGFKQLEIRFFPKFETPIVRVHIYYEGASADLMESQVTRLVENALSGIDNVKAISSVSRTAHSYVWVTFRLHGNFEEEASEVRDKVSGIRDDLPANINSPTITVGATGSDLLSFGFTDDQKSSADIRDYIETNISPVLRKVEGVGSVSVVGASDYAMRIWLNATKMAVLNVTIADVKAALLANNIYFSAGSFYTPSRTYGLIAETQLKNATEFGNIIIKHSTQGTIRLNDVAQVALGNRSLYEFPMLINGKPGVQVIVRPLQLANPVDVAMRVKAAIKPIQSNLPPGMHVATNYDMSLFLQSSINETFIAIGEAILLVIVVVFLFLGSFRASLIPIVTIPASLIPAFFLIQLLGYTINIMSLLGMVLAIGLVVDDSIVVLENIHRHMEEGMSAVEAAIRGSREIAGAVIIMSVTLIAVYAPVVFIQGVTSELFKEFALTLASAVAISAVVALTLSPMMCANILKPETKETQMAKWLDATFWRLNNVYQRLLKHALVHRQYILLSLVGIGLLGYIIYVTLSSEFLPPEDYGVFNVSLSAPTGSSLDYTKRYVEQVENVIKQVPEINRYIVQVRASSMSVVAALKPWGQRKRSTSQIIGAINPKLQSITGIDATAYMPDIIDYGETGHDIDFIILTSATYEDLVAPMSQAEKILKKFPGVTGVGTDLRFDAQQYALTLNRNLIGALGVDIQDIADAVSALMGGNHWTDVVTGERSYAVIVQMRQEDLKNFNGINKIYIQGAPITTSTADTTTPMIPLSSLIKLTPRIGQGSLHHYNGFRSGTLYAHLKPGYTESEAIQYILKKITPTIPRKMSYAFSGKSAQFLESSGSITGMIVLAFIFIYLMLSAQFGSFIDPFVVLFSVPLSIVGALIFLKLGQGSFNLYSEIGMITLIGLISKHGILITQFINDARKSGLSISDAIIEGSTLRLRPILMTTFAMVFGAIPLALATGPGSIGRVQIGLVVVGGLLCGTFFSLFLVPVVYSYLGRFRRIKSAK